jgi:hypothetical protein
MRRFDVSMPRPPAILILAFNLIKEHLPMMDCAVFVDYRVDLDNNLDIIFDFKTLLFIGFKVKGLAYCLYLPNISTKPVKAI